MVAMAKTGRPTKYKPEYCEAIVAFFDVKPYRNRRIPHYEKSGKVDEKGNRVVVWYDRERIANDVPWFGDFCASIGAHIDTVLEWSKQHAEFSGAYARAKDLQKRFLVINGLAGIIDSNFAKFTAVNITDMRDKSEIKQANTYDPKEAEAVRELLLDSIDDSSSSD